jgi:peptidyl-prolyl cis-trans isomerase C
MKTLKGLPLAALVLLTACNKAGPPADTASKSADKAVATVNGTPITREMYDFYAKNTAGKPAAELNAETRNQLLDNLVRGEVIAQEAVKQGLDKTGDPASMLALSRLQILQQAGATHYLDGKKPTDDELKAEYDSQLAQMPKVQYHARHILVAGQDAAQKIIDQLKKGAKFEELAKKNSTDSSKDQGGDLGWFSPTSMVPQFAAAVSALKKNEYTQTPVQTQYGYHVIQLLDTRETPVPPFDQVKDRVAQFVEQKKFKAYEDDLVKSAKVEKTLEEPPAAAAPAAAAPPATGAMAPANPAAKPAQ